MSHASIELLNQCQRPQFICGSGAIYELGKVAKKLKAQKVLVVSDQGIIDAGHTARGTQALHQAGLETFLFSEFHENPITEHVDLGADFARSKQIDLIVGLGGGSSMDCAKGINFLLSGGGQMQDYWGVGKAKGTLLPMIAVPTTSGTGSESQSFALISDAKTHVKMACGDKQAACRYAILDPELTLTQPTAVTALTGIDAIAHALETYVTTKRNEVSKEYSRQAWRLLAENFLKVIQQPEDLKARAAMQYGAALAGLAIEHSMLGGAHALANPLTATFGLIHGQAIAISLPHIIRFNGEQEPCDHWYGELLQISHPEFSGQAQSNSEFLAAQLTDWVKQAGLKTTIRSAVTDFSKTQVSQLAEDAEKQWTGTFNPRKLELPLLAKLYEQAS